MILSRWKKIAIKFAKHDGIDVVLTKRSAIGLVSFVALVLCISVPFPSVRNVMIRALLLSNLVFDCDGTSSGKSRSRTFEGNRLETIAVDRTAVLITFFCRRSTIP